MCLYFLIPFLFSECILYSGLEDVTTHANKEQNLFDVQQETSINYQVIHSANYLKRTCNSTQLTDNIWTRSNTA